MPLPGSVHPNGFPMSAAQSQLNRIMKAPQVLDESCPHELLSFDNRKSIAPVAFQQQNYEESPNEALMEQRVSMMPHEAGVAAESPINTSKKYRL